MKPRVIAFYLPQFHPMPENDEWWGKGFTEWTNVGKAKPLFKGHNQPRVPADLGYYDLRLPEVREEQANLAKEAGIEGFMYWHYWFGNGKTLMADIFKDVLESGKPDLPFCIGWANHSWFSKLWDKDGKSTNKLLVEQQYSGIKDARMYFDSLLPAFKDERYIKVDGKPIFYVFDPIKMPKEYIDWFNKWAIEFGLPGIYFVANLVGEYDKEPFLNKGYNAVTYQRLSSGTPKAIASLGKYGRYLNKIAKKVKGFIYHRPPRMEDYVKASQHFVTEKEKENDVIPTIIPQWDHTPRSGWNGNLLVNSTPERFYIHAKKGLEAVRNKPDQEKIVFLKSWNEWGEGNFMEPDLTFGKGYIKALAKAIDDSFKK